MAASTAISHTLRQSEGQRPSGTSTQDSTAQGGTCGPDLLDMSPALVKVNWDEATALAAGQKRLDSGQLTVLNYWPVGESTRPAQTERAKSGGSCSRNPKA